MRGTYTRGVGTRWFYDRGVLVRGVGVLGSLLLATVPLLPAGCSKTSTPPAEAVRIGLLVPLAGTDQGVGAEIRDAFQQYLDLRSGKLGGHPVQLVVADEGDTAVTAAATTTKLIEQEKVVAVAGMFGPATSGTTLPMFSRAQLPVLVTSVRSEPKDPVRTWHTSYSPREPAVAVAERIKEAAKGPVFVIGPDNQNGWEELGGLVESLVRAGGSLANSGNKPLYTPPGTTGSFTNYLNQIRWSGAKAVYCGYTGAQAVEFLKQYAQSEVKALPVYGAGPLTEGDMLTAEGATAQNVYSSFNYAPDLENAQNKIFVASWKLRHPASPTAQGVAAYDAAAVLDQALSQIAGKVTAAQVTTAIGRLGLVDSPRGTWQFSAKTHSPVQKWYLRQVRSDGRGLANSLVEDLITIGE
jgi:branched-chain amino acid transport system substrate-binding protein